MEHTRFERPIRGWAFTHLTQHYEDDIRSGHSGSACEKAIIHKNSKAGGEEIPAQKGQDFFCDGEGVSHGFIDR